MSANTTYVLFYDYPETNGVQVAWDNDGATVNPYHYPSLQACFDDFIYHEGGWGRSLYAVPPQIREYSGDDPTGKVWQINITELGYNAVPLP